jgi:nucleotide-binding universal stress UspA family protein/MFS family permease
MSGHLAAGKHARMALGRTLPSPLLPSTRAVRFQPGPLAGRYPAAAAMVILFLTPYLALSSALPPVAPIIAAQLHMSLQAVNLTSGMANAGYAAGTVLAVQFSQLLPQRRMLLVYGTMLVAGSVLAAAAASPAMFIAGHVLQGLSTGLLLIAAAPPLFLGYPASKLRWTVMILDMCIFGAVAAGPLIGGAQASFHAWRPLFWVVAGVAVMALLLSLLTFEDAPPANPSAPRDPAALGLAAAGSVAAFWGASELLTHRFLDPVAAVPLLGGVALITLLLVYQYRARRPLLTVRNLNSTIPLSAIVALVCAAAASVAAITLTGTVLTPHYTPLHLGLLYVPELGGAVIAAIAFGMVVSRRLLHYFVLAGMVFLAAGILVLRAAVPPTAGLALAGSALVGVGVGASVTPALFLIGFSLRSPSIQRVFSISEMLRAVAAFVVAPVLLHFAVTPTGLPTPAMSTALWICFGLAIGGALVGVLLYLLGGVRPSASALHRWMGGREPGWESPPLLAAVRHGPAEQVLGRTPARAGSGHGSGGRIAASLTSLPHRHAVHGHGDHVGPVVFAYDGSDLAKAAIAEAGRQLPAKRDALVLTVWRTYNVGFLPEPGAKFDAACADEVMQAAEQTAMHGASLAETAGFRARASAVQGTPAWKAIVDTADDHQASLIVLGSRGRAGLGLVAGSVAAAVASRSLRPVLIVRGRDSAPTPETSASATASEAVDNEALK